MKRKLKLIANLINLCFVFSISLCLFSCAKKYDSVDLFYFNAPIHIQVEGARLNEDIKEDLKSLFFDIQNEFDKNDANSMVYKFNNANINEKFETSEHFKALFCSAKELYKYSDGLFNPSIYPLLETWNFAPNFPIDNFSPPSKDQIQSSLQKVIDFSSLEFDQNNKILTKNLHAELDFGGIVKGYAVEQAGELLKQNGYKKGYVNIGGSSIYVLNFSDLSIRHPIMDKNLDNIAKFNIEDMNNFSLSTSGDYEKYYVHDKVRYSHIINPKTGYPAMSDIKSVSIINADGAESDALSTACCLIEHNPNEIDASKLVIFLKDILAQKKAQFVFTVYSKDGVNQIITNAKKGEHFTLLDNDFSVVNI